MTENEYYTHGCTALLDAAGGGIHHIGNIPEKTLFIITTDGMENASHKYNYAKVKWMIERQKKKNTVGNFCFSA